MEKLTKDLIKFARLYSMDYKNPQSLYTLYVTICKVNKNHHHSVVIPAIKAMNEKGYRAFIDYIHENGDFDDVWLFDIYRNAPDEECCVTVEEFDAEDLSFIK